MSGSRAKRLRRRVLVVCRKLDDPGDLAYMVPGARTDECSRCELAIALSPAGQRFIGKLPPGATVLVCHECVANVPEDDLKGVYAVPGALDELHGIGQLLDVHTEGEFVRFIRENRWGSRGWNT